MWRKVMCMMLLLSMMLALAACGNNLASVEQEPKIRDVVAEQTAKEQAELDAQQEQSRKESEEDAESDQSGADTNTNSKNNKTSKKKQLIKASVYWGDGTLQRGTLYEYDEFGVQYGRYFKLDEAGNLKYDADYGYGFDFFREYDQDGRIIRYREYIHQSSPTVEIEYDSHGNGVIERECYDSGNVYENRIENEYDSDGNIIKYEHYIKPYSIPDYLWLYEYNKDGNQMGYYIERASDLYYYCPAGELVEYDTLHNPIKTTTYRVSEKHQFTVSGIQMEDFTVDDYVLFWGIDETPQITNGMISNFVADDYTIYEYDNEGDIIKQQEFVLSDTDHTYHLSEYTIYEYE